MLAKLQQIEKGWKWFWGTWVGTLLRLIIWVIVIVIIIHFIQVWQDKNIYQAIAQLLAPIGINLDTPARWIQFWTTRH